MDYLDFDLRIANGSGHAYPVTVLRSPAGEANGTLRLPFDASGLERHLLSVQEALLRSVPTRGDTEAKTAAAAAGDPDEVRAFGRGLFESLFADQVATSFRRSRDRAMAEGKGLRVRLRIEPPELSALPWEFLYDPEEADYLCLSTGTPLVRYLECDEPPEAVSVQPPLTVLGVVASPTDRPALDVARERERIQRATASLQAQGALSLEWLPAATWRELQRALRRGRYHVLHFVGHGGFDETAGEGVLALTDDAGASAVLGATEVGRLLADHQDLRVVLLNSCLGARASGTDVFSSTAAVLVRRGVPSVLAMQYEISDEAAIEFSRSFYEAVADGLAIDSAVAEARKAVSLGQRRSVEWATPVLHMRSPDGVLFRVGGRGTPLTSGAPGGEPPRQATVQSSAPPAAPAPAAPAPSALAEPPAAVRSAGAVEATPVVPAAAPLVVRVSGPSQLQVIGRFLLACVLGFALGITAEAIAEEAGLLAPSDAMMALSVLVFTVLSWFGLGSVRALNPSDRER